MVRPSSRPEFDQFHWVGHDDEVNEFKIGESTDTELVVNPQLKLLAEPEVNLIPAGNQALTLGSGATTFAVTGKTMTVTGDGGANTIATISGGIDGMILTLIFVDALVTITDTATEAADTVNLSAAFTGADGTVLLLSFDGTSWREISRSVNG